MNRMRRRGCVPCCADPPRVQTDTTKLRNLSIGAQGRVMGYDTEDRAYRQKLIGMGLVRGVEFTLVRVAPMGDPVELRLNGYSVMLRKDEADALEIQVL